MKKTILQFSPHSAWINFIALACFLTAITLHAATQTWNNGAANSTWNTSSLNWSGAAWTDGNDAVFGATGAGAITVSGIRIVGNLTNSVSGYSFSGGTLSNAFANAANTWSNGADITISSGVTADFTKTGGGTSGSLTKVGAGTLTLSGANNVTGFGATGSGNHGILVSAGSLVLNGTSTFSNAWLLVGTSGASATISGGTHNFTGTLTRRGLAMGGSGSGGSITVSGGNVTTANITLGNGASGIFTQSGGTVTASLVQLGSAGNSGSTSVFNLDGGVFQVAQLAPNAGWLGTSTINLNGGTFQATGSSVNIFSPTVTGSQPGSVFVSTNGAVIDSNGNNTTNSSALLHNPALGGTADGGLTKLGGVNTKLTLSGASTYTGGTTISGGILVADNNSALGTGPVTNAATALVVNDGITISNNITIKANTGTTGLIQNSGTGTATLNGGTITINNSPAAGGHFWAVAGGTIDVYDPINSTVGIVMRGDTTGKLILRGGGSYTILNHQNGKVALGANNGISTSAKIGNFGANGAAILDLAGYNQTLVGMTKFDNTSSATISNSVASSTSVLTTTGTSTYGGTIVDGTATAAKVALTVNGGSLTLTNKNTYSGDTTINNGSLVGVVGGPCSNSAVSVAATSGNNAILGISITDNTKSWTCASLTVDNTAGVSSGLNFDFTAGSPSATVAPLVITGAATNTTPPTVTVALGAVSTITAGNSYPLIARASSPGNEPTAVTVTTTTLGATVAAHLAVTGTTNYLVIDTADSLRTWDNSSGNFTWDITSTNWSGAVWADGIDAVFGATGVGAITVNGTRSVGNLTITNNGYSFSGGTLSVAKLSAANTWSNSSDTTISAGVTADFSKPGGSINGTLTKVGAGTLTLSGAVNATGTNTSSGNFGITVSAGSLVLNGTSTFTNAALFAAAAGASVTFSGGTHNFTGTVNRKGLSIGGNGGAITVSGGNVTTLNLTVGNGSSATYTQSGGTVAATSVQLGAAAGSTSTSVFNLDGGIFQSVQLAPSAGWLGTSTINLNGGTFQANGSTTNLFVATVTGSQPGSVFVKTNGAVIDSNGYNITNSSSLLTDGTGGGLTKLGSGALTLAGTNTYSGNTTISAGTLALGANGYITNSATIVVASNAIFNVSARSTAFTLAQALSGQTLSNSAPGAIINGTNNCSNGTLSLVYDGVNPCFIQTNGGMTLSGATTFLVNNTGTQLAHSTNKIIAKATGGLVAGSLPAVTVAGAGTVVSPVSLQLVSGELYLNVNNPPVATNINLGAQAGVQQTLQIIGSPKYAPTDADTDTLTLTATSSGTNGGVVGISGSSVTYSNNAVGADIFTYTVSDGYGGFATATVYVNVTNVTNQQASISYSGGAAALTFWGIPGTSYTIQRSTNASDWSAAIDLGPVTASVTPPYGQVSLSDSTSPASGSYFFRLKP